MALEYSVTLVIKMGAPRNFRKLLERLLLLLINITVIGYTR